MAWFDFSDLVTDHFDMSDDVALRFFLLVSGGTTAGQPQPSTYTELFFTAYTPVPRPPKNFYQQIPVSKRERDHCLVWMPPNEIGKLTTAKTSTGENAGRILDVQESKWYVVVKTGNYLRQGNLHGAIGELADGPPPNDLPAPPP